MTEQEKIDAVVEFLTAPADGYHNPGAWLGDVFVFCALYPEPKHCTLFAHRRADLIALYDEAASYDDVDSLWDAFVEIEPPTDLFSVDEQATA